VSCWNCGADEVARPSCPACGKVSARRPGQTHFDTFGLAPTLRPDVPALERIYRERSLQLHPDRIPGASPVERRFSIEQTAALNEGLRVLKDPVRLAFYVLGLSGVDLEREEGQHRQALPMEFLEEILELRETLAEVRAAKDLGRAQQMGREVRARMTSTLARAQTALEARLSSPADDAALREATAALAQVRYFGRFLEEVTAMEEEALA
jgi:molecular chaperone HscB